MKSILVAERMKDIEKSELRKLFDQAPPDSINLGLGEIQFPTPKVVIDKAIEVLKQKRIRYTPNAGLPELQKAISEYYHISLNNNVCITTGAEEALFDTLFSYVTPGDEVMIANPTYVAYKPVIKMLGGIAVEFNLDPATNFELDIADFEKKITSKTKILLLNNPSNPTGRCYSPKEIDFMISKCMKNNILIIVDEIYRDLYTNKRPMTFIEKKGNIIVVSGLSKSHCMSGWRLGWAVSNNHELIKPIITSHQYICTCAPYLSQQAAITALSKEGMDAQNVIRNELKSNKKFLVNQLTSSIPNLSFLKNTSGPYLFVNVKTDDVLLVNKLIESGLIVMPGSIFGSNGKHWIRLNYAVDKKKLAKGIEILNFMLYK